MLTTLPPEIILQVVDLLPVTDQSSLAGVNKRLQTLVYLSLYKQPKISTKEQLASFATISAYAQSFVKKLDFSKVHLFVTPDLFTSQLQHLTNLTYVNLSECQKISRASVAALIKNNVDTVEHLVIDGLYFDNDVLKWIGVATRYRLINLSMSTTYSWPPNSVGGIDDLGAMLTLPGKLETLNLSKCQWFGEESMANVVKNLPCLKELNLWWAGGIALDTLLFAAAKLPCLQKIDTRWLITHDMQFYRDWRNRNPELMSRICGSSVKEILYTLGDEYAREMCPSLTMLSTPNKIS